MRWLSRGLALIILGSLTLSLWLLVSVFRDVTPNFTVAAELLLVIVLAAEGIYAVFHVWESKSARQADAFLELRSQFEEEVSLLSSEELHTELGWAFAFEHIPAEELKWIQEREEGRPVVYTCESCPKVKISITMKDPHWKKIQSLGGHYHFAGISCAKNYLDRQDVSDWLGPQPRKWWMRLGGIINAERKRRQHKGFFQGWEDLAKATPLE